MNSNDYYYLKGYFTGRLEEFDKGNPVFNVFVDKINYFIDRSDFVLDDKLLEEWCEIYCDDVSIVEYNNSKYIVVGNDIGIVYLKEGKVKLLKEDEELYKIILELL